MDANFKEVQLKKPSAIGQDGDAEVRSNTRGKVEYTPASVVGASAAALGSAFALIPAQNATGNWIKVVQRLPVRIRLDGPETAS